MLDIFTETYTYIFLAFNFFYGLSSFVSSWNGFFEKLINISFLFGFLSFISILSGTRGLDAGLGLALIGAVVCWLGNQISASFEDDLRVIFIIFFFLALVSMFVMLGLTV